jgi:ABC-2 type transport system ATP-binding protein
MTSAVELVDISKRYGRHKALDAVSMSVAPGEILGIIGPNGAGKTTLLRLVAGLLHPTSGSVRFEKFPRPDGIRYFAGEHTLPPNVSATRWLSLWSAGENGVPRRRLSTLSRGTRQAVGLRATLAEEETSLLLLDEPWESLDPDASRWLCDQLSRKRQTGAAIVVSSHRIHDLAAVCTRCEFLVGGRIAADGIVIHDDESADERVASLFSGFDRARKRP